MVQTVSGADQVTYNPPPKATPPRPSPFHVPHSKQKPSVQEQDVSGTGKALETLRAHAKNATGKLIAGGLGNLDGTAELWEHFLKCVRSQNRETLCPPELGAAAFTTVNMGVQSYRNGHALFWDKEQRKPVFADDTWARKWEQRSKERGKPSHVIGWKGGNNGSVVVPPEYQKLAGPWIDGKDPSEKNTSSRKS